MASSYGFVTFCVFVLLHNLTGDAEWAIEDDGCHTPDNKAGTCIEIHSCEHIMDILDAASQPISPEITKLLRSYHCGFSGRIPKMCCPPKPIIMDRLAAMKNVSTPLPPDVSAHKNIGILPKECGFLDTGEKIVNGNKTGLFEYPWMALLFYKTNRTSPDFQCGASIINEKYVLTAAHCITNLESPLLGVRVGEHNIKTPIDCELTSDQEKICAPPFRDLNIEEIIPHPKYNTRTHANDIGLLRVTPMNFSIENIKPVCLPLGSARIYNFSNRICVVTGWGATKTKRFSPQLMQAQIPVVPNEQCAKIYKKQVKITHRHMCAGGGKSDSCGGDSGGPLQVLIRLHRDVRLIQQGVVSMGPRYCAKGGLPGVYTRVAYYMNWILNKMRS